MNHDSHEHPLISILSGTAFGLMAYIHEHGFIMDFGIDLIKVCLFGFAGGIFGLIGKRFWIKVTRKNHNHDTDSK